MSVRRDSPPPPPPPRLAAIGMTSWLAPDTPASSGKTRGRRVPPAAEGRTTAPRTTARRRPLSGAGRLRLFGKRRAQQRTGRWRHSAARLGRSASVVAGGAGGAPSGNGGGGTATRPPGPARRGGGQSDAGPRRRAVEAAARDHRPSAQTLRHDPRLPGGEAEARRRLRFAPRSRQGRLDLLRGFQRSGAGALHQGRDTRSRTDRANHDEQARPAGPVGPTYAEGQHGANGLPRSVNFRLTETSGELRPPSTTTQIGILEFRIKAPTNPHRQLHRPTEFTFRNAEVAGLARDRHRAPGGGQIEDRDDQTSSSAENQGGGSWHLECLALTGHTTPRPTFTPRLRLGAHRRQFYIEPRQQIRRHARDATGPSSRFPTSRPRS